MMTPNRLMFEERVRLTKAIAHCSPTSEHLAAHGLAIMDLGKAEAARLLTEAAANVLDDRPASRHPLLVVSPQPRRAQVGDRVRIRSGSGKLIDCSELPHFAEETGHIGTVCAEGLQPGVRDHPFLIMFDKPVPTVVTRAGVMPLPARHYALAELEFLV